MRASADFIEEASDFARNGALDKLRSVERREKRRKRSKTKASLPCAFQIYCVRIQPESGEDEFLIANLPRKEFSMRKLGYVIKSLKH